MLVWIGVGESASHRAWFVFILSASSRA